MTENNRVEYKRELTDGLEKEVVAFLNAREGGLLYIGLDDDGTAVGVQYCDQLQLAIKDRLKNNIQPSMMGLFEIIHEQRDGKDVIRITIAGGLEKPYYLKKFGMTEKGCFLRIGSAAEPMPKEMIESFYGKRVRNTIGRMESPRRDLSFEQLKIYYETRGLHLNDAFMKNLELFTPEDKPNYAAYLLADENGISLQVAKYAGTDRVDLIENRDYGRCSLIKALKSLLDRVAVENTVFTKITYPLRQEQELINSIAIREAIINAVVHNDYSYGAGTALYPQITSQNPCTWGRSRRGAQIMVVPLASAATQAWPVCKDSLRASRPAVICCVVLSCNGTTIASRARLAYSEVVPKNGTDG